MMAETICEILAEHNPRRLRSNPRVLKRATLYYPPKRSKHHRWPSADEIAT